MKYDIYYDSGTTNSRAYLIGDGRVADRMSEAVGTVNNVLSGDRDTLVRGLYRMYQTLLSRNGLADEAIDGVYMSGMATSKNGVSEVGYVRLPVDLKCYRQAVTYRDNEVFGRKIGYLTGLAGMPDEPGSLKNAAEFNNVRGEEIELFGIMEQYAAQFENRKAAVIMPGSHTHVLFAENKSITGILSCMGGELFAAVSRHTILNASVSENPENPDASMVEAMKEGYDAVTQYGFNRALYLVRTLDLFTDAAPGQRDFFLEGVVNAGILTGIRNSRHFAGLDHICVAGKKVYYDIFNGLLSHAGIGLPCLRIEPGEESFALRGFLELLKVSDCKPRY